MSKFLPYALLLGCGLLIAPCALRGAPRANDDFHGVIVHDLDIDGRVYIISGERDNKGRIPDPRPAPGGRVEIRTVAEDKVIAQARTDDQGRYTLPRIDVGKYKVCIGLLRMDLEVWPAAAASNTSARSFVVLVPEEMAPADR